MINKKNKFLLIYGTGEIARLAHFYFTNDSDYEVKGFCADEEYIKEDKLFNLPIVPSNQVENLFPPSDYYMHVALSYKKLNKNRNIKYDYSKSLGYELASYICTKSVFWKDIKHGDNCFILENQTIQPTTSIGNNVMLWSGNHIGHASIIKDHVYISSHVVISGHCSIGKRCFLGVNSTIKDFCTIEDNCFIGMGAIVTRNIKENSVVLNKSSEIIDENDPRNKRIIEKYFK